MLGQWSPPLRDDAVSTRGAWWLIEVLGKEDDRPLSQGDLDYLTSDLLNTWLQALLQSQAVNVQDLLDENQTQWILDHAARD